MNTPDIEKYATGGETLQPGPQYERESTERKTECVNQPLPSPPSTTAIIHLVLFFFPTAPVVHRGLDAFAGRSLRRRCLWTLFCLFFLLHQGGAIADQVPESNAPARGAKRQKGKKARRRANKVRQHKIIFDKKYSPTKKAVENK